MRCGCTASVLGRDGGGDVGVHKYQSSPAQLELLLQEKWEWWQVWSGKAGVPSVCWSHQAVQASYSSSFYQTKPNPPWAGLCQFSQFQLVEQRADQWWLVPLSFHTPGLGPHIWGREGRGQWGVTSSVRNRIGNIHLIILLTGTDWLLDLKDIKIHWL